MASSREGTTSGWRFEGLGSDVGGMRTARRGSEDSIVGYPVGSGSCWVVSGEHAAGHDAPAERGWFVVDGRGEFVSMHAAPMAAIADAREMCTRAGQDPDCDASGLSASLDRIAQATGIRDPEWIVATSEQAATPTSGPTAIRNGAMLARALFEAGEDAGVIAGGEAAAATRGISTAFSAAEKGEVVAGHASYLRHTIGILSSRLTEKDPLLYEVPKLDLALATLGAAEVQLAVKDNRITSGFTAAER